MPGVPTSRHLGSSGGSVYGIRLEVLPTLDKACFVTLSGSKGRVPAADTGVIAATAQFPQDGCVRPQVP